MAKIKVRGNNLLNRACSKLNGPPKRVISANTIQMFKTRLDTLLMAEWFEVPIPRGVCDLEENSLHFPVNS